MRTKGRRQTIVDNAWAGVGEVVSHVRHRGECRAIWELFVQTYGDECAELEPELFRAFRRDGRSIEFTYEGKPAPHVPTSDVGLVAPTPEEVAAFSKQRPDDRVAGSVPPELIA